MVKGIGALHKRLSQVPERIRRVVDPELARQMDGLNNVQKMLAPKDKLDLVKSIKWRKGGKGFKPEDIAATAYAAKGDKDFHGLFQEFGTVNMPANPFFFPAYRQKKKAIKAALKKAVKKGLSSA